MIEGAVTPKKVYCTTDPTRHTFLETYLQELQSHKSLENMFKVSYDVDNSMLNKILDMSKEK